jgi:hypothetical protein
LELNKTMKSLRLPALAMAALIAAAGAAGAQTPPSPPPATASAHPWAEGMHEHMEAMHAARLRALHEALNIRPDQEAAFQTFAASMHGGDGDHPGGPDGKMGEHPMMGGHDGMGAMTMAPMTAPERLDAMAHRMDEHMARMRERFQRHLTAVKVFYAVLDANQKHTFDGLLVLLGHPGMEHEGMGPDGWGHGDMGHGDMGHGGMGGHDAD